jgi:hypothetical protein
MENALHLAALFQFMAVILNKWEDFLIIGHGGHEDVVIVKRAEKYRIHIDRSIFFELGHPNIIQFNDEKTRNVDISTAFVDDDYLNTYKIIMNLKYTFYDNNAFYGNFVYIDNFDLALEKHIYNYTIDLKKGEEHHKQHFGKIKQQYKEKYGEGGGGGKGLFYK